MTNKEVKQIVDNWSNRILEIQHVGPDHETIILYINYDEKTNELYAGHASNIGVSKKHSIQYDKDFSLHENIDTLFEECVAYYSENEQLKNKTI